MFGTTTIVGNVEVSLASDTLEVGQRRCPFSATKGQLLDGICWFITVFSLTTSLGRVSTVFMLVLLTSMREPGSGLVTHTAANHSLGWQPPG